MSLRPAAYAEVPASTAAVARAAFPRGNPYLCLRDALGTVFSDAQIAPLFPSRGRPAEALWRLALVTLRQFAENRSDRRAADAVRGRIDWKYLLGLELAADKQIALWFLDEARVGQKGRTTHCWWVRWQRPPGVSDKRFECAYIFAAVRPSTREDFALVHACRLPP